MIGTQDGDLISRVLTSFTRQNEALFDQLTSILYYFRGAFGRDDVWNLSYLEREKCIEFLNKRMDDARDMMKHHVPVFI